jgi:hypothetical protein
MDEEEVECKPCTWVGVFVYSHEQDENIFVGALRFGGKELVLSRKLAGFVEVYGRRIPPGEIPRVTVTIGDLVVTGKRFEVSLRRRSTRRMCRTTPTWWSRATGW